MSKLTALGVTPSGQYGMELGAALALGPGLIAALRAHCCGWFDCAWALAFGSEPERSPCPQIWRSDTNTGKQKTAQA